jgi:hypothetical protein
MGAESMAMDIRVKDKIEDIADDIASALQNSQAALEQQILDLEKRLAELHAERNLARSAANRAANMEVFVNNHYECPRCWVMRGEHAKLRPVPSETGDDIFRCQKCREELRVPYD